MPARTRLTGRAIAAAIAVLSLAAAAGCGGEPETNIEPADDQPKRSEEQAKDDKPSPEPTFEVEEEPVVQTALGYYEAFNKANDTGDVGRLRELFTDDCKACRLTADRLEVIYADGGNIEGGDLRRVDSEEVQAEGNPDEGPMSVTIIYQYEAETLIEKAGGEAEKLPEEFTEKRFTLTLVDETWKISDLTTEDYKP